MKQAKTDYVCGSECKGECSGEVDGRCHCPVTDKKKKTKVINFIGSPGAGKSTLAAKLFAHMKSKDINCELVTEYAKGVVWRGAQNILTNQVYMFAKQYDKQFHLMDKVDYIITDSPLFLNLYYGQHERMHFKYLVMEKWDEFENINFYVKRTKKYNPKGRNQTAAESDEISTAIVKLLAENKIRHREITSDTPIDDIYYYVNPMWNHAYYLPGMKTDG
jgi:nicotinamide riboside kinase